MTTLQVERVPEATDTHKRLPHRGLYPILGVLINLCLGNLYAWSVFRKPLQATYGWSSFEATLPFALCIAFFALAMVLAGRWQDRVGPRIVAMAGGVAVGIGFILAGLIGNTLLGLYLSFGVIVGLGIGAAYVTPIATVVKWWPDRRGLMTGLVVMGFGAGSIIGGLGGPLLIEQFGSLPTFIVFGILFGLLITAGGAFLRNPPAGWTPPAPLGRTTTKKHEHDYAASEILKTGRFWLLWFMYLISAGVGLIVISQASPIGQEIAQLTPIVAGGAVTILALFNGLGRLGFGWLSDFIGRHWSMALLFTLNIAALALVLPNATNLGLYVLGVSIVGFAYGGCFSLMPAFTADFFGTKNLGVNYGWLFSAYGVAGALLTLFAIQVREVTGAWMTTFYFMAIASALGLILALVTRASAARST